MSAAEHGSPPRAWHDQDRFLPLEMPDLTQGPEGPFFMHPVAAQPGRIEMLTLAKIDVDSESIIHRLMDEMGILPVSPEGKRTVQTAINTAASIYRDEYVPPSGFESREAKARLHELREGTQRFESLPLLQAAHTLWELYPNTRNTEAEMIVRLLITHEAAINS